MVEFSTIIRKFSKKGEKTGWTYLEIESTIANLINPNTKTSFRVKGTINDSLINQVALMPMGNGNFILPLNMEIRKGIHKKIGEKVTIRIEKDNSELVIDATLLDSLELEPNALSFFNSLSKGHQRYFSNWISEAKTIETKSKRLYMCVSGLSEKMDFGEMIRFFKKNKEKES